MGAHENAKRDDLKAMREAIVHAKCYEDLDAIVAPWTGEQEWAEIVEAIEKRGGQRAPPHPLPPIEEVEVAPFIPAALPVSEAETQKENDAASTASQEAPVGPNGASTADKPQIPPTASLLGLDVPPPPSSEAVNVTV